MFDPTQFTQQVVQAEGATRIKPVPKGEWVGYVDAETPVDKWFKAFEIKKGPNAGQSLIRCDVPLRIDNDNLAQQLGRSRIIVVWECIIDTIPGTTQFDMSEGKNLKLNQLREAVGQNRADLQWHIGMLPDSGPLLIRTDLEPNENDPDNPYTRVKAVVRPR